MKEQVDFTVGLQEFQNGEKMFVMPYHQEDVQTHDHSFFELAYITGGSARHTLDGETAVVQKGDYFIVDYGSKHSYTESRDFDLINCLFQPEIIDETLEGCRSFDQVLRVCLIRYYNRFFGMTPVNRVFRDEDGRILELLLGMQRECANREVGYAEIFRGRLMEILILTMRKIVDAEQMAQRKKHSVVVQQAIQYLQANYQEKAVLRSFCGEYHYSLQYVSRRFKEETGMTVMEYLQRVRVEKGCGLLEGSEMEVEDIAREVGYEDAKFFGRVFRRWVKMGPGEYRRIRGEKN